MFLLDTFGRWGGARRSHLTISHALALISRLRAELAAAPETTLRERAEILKREAQAGADAGDWPARAVALAAEAIRRAHGLTPHRVQLLAGLLLTEGRLAEMATGEGKTLVALLPAVCAALHGRGVHVATVNRYLAERDAEFAAAALSTLGLTVACLPEGGPGALKRPAYAADVTYGVGTEFGFDYLRDQLTLRSHRAAHASPRYHDLLLGRAVAPPELCQRGQVFAVIDEADSVLIDEARSPLVISLGAPQPSSTPEVYRLAARLAEAYREEGDFTRDPHTRALALTPAGSARAFDALPEALLAQLRRSWPLYVETALRARHEFQRDVHYLVQGGKIIIVDEFTGRSCPERSWRDGLHQAIEAEAGAAITEENRSEATITRPVYFRLYERMCGMTGTAREAAAELRTTYELRTSLVPLHRPSRRLQLPDRVFATRGAKLAAVVREAAARRERGQPVLVGTRTVEASEALAEVLAAAGVPFVLLNAKRPEEEARIVAQAGQPGTITLATNMAGRGAHIPVPEESLRAGGLHVLGLERHESARIDRQLLGRAARQGQPGGCQFFVSLDDELLSRYAPALQARLRRRRANSAGELPAALARHFLRLQRHVEAADRAARAALAAQDRWLDELKQIL